MSSKRVVSEDLNLEERKRPRWRVHKEIPEGYFFDIGDGYRVYVGKIFIFLSN